jgi:2',3'-cyclic-nucleotide 2'-phosphodiesterase (5'-nucleotidase family)
MSSRPTRTILHSSFCVLRSSFILLLLAGCATTSQPTRFRILQLNDVYKIEGLARGEVGGLARVRTLRKQLEADGTAVLVLHAGDALYPSVMSKYLEAQPIVDVMNMLDGDPDEFDPGMIVTFGNHEFDNKTPDKLLARLSESRFQWVSSNTLTCTSLTDCPAPFRTKAPEVKDTVVVDAGGTRVGIFGILYPMSDEERQNKAYFKSTDAAAAARAAIASLKAQGARVIVALTHQDMPLDEQLVRDVPEIDLVVGGHDHLYMQSRVGSTWITKADADAKSVIVYDVAVPPSGPIRTTPLRVTLDATQPQDPDVNAAVARWQAQLGPKLPEGKLCVLGRTKNLLEGTEPAVRGRETALGNMLADIIRDNTGTQIAFLNGGSIRINDDIPPGPITNYDLEGIVYYDNDLVSFNLTGADIMEILTNSVSRADSGDGRFLQISGMSFDYQKQGNTFVVTRVSVGGQPLDPKATYSASTVSFEYEQGIEDGYTIFTDGRRPPEIKPRVKSLKTLTRNYIRAANPEVTTDIDGRIVRDGGGAAAAVPTCP